MRKAEKVMIAKAEAVCKEWDEDYSGTGAAETKCVMDDLIDALRAAIKKVKGEV